MPITKRELQLGISQEIGELMRKVYDLLESHRDLAFSKLELEKEVAPSSSDWLQRALDVLVEMGAVERRVIDGQSYFAFRRSFDKNTWKGRSRWKFYPKLKIRMPFKK